jgi:hypothetical protein
MNENEATIDTLFLGKLGRKDDLVPLVPSLEYIRARIYLSEEVKRHSSLCFTLSLVEHLYSKGYPILSYHSGNQNKNICDDRGFNSFKFSSVNGIWYYEGASLVYGEMQYNDLVWKGFELFSAPGNSLDVKMKQLIKATTFNFEKPLNYKISSVKRIK